MTDKLSSWRLKRQIESLTVKQDDLLADEVSENAAFSSQKQTSTFVKKSGDVMSGNLSFRSDGITWDDLRVTPAGFDRAGVADPSLVSYQPSGSGIATYLYEFQKDDIAYFSVQLPHSYKEGSDLHAHIHWTPGARGNEESGALVGWKIDYTWAGINGNFGVMSTIDLSDACDGVDHKHQMTPSVTILGTDKKISSMLICNIKRTDTGADDTWAGTASGQLPLLLEIDFHYQIDSLGSRDAGVK